MASTITNLQPEDEEQEKERSQKVQAAIESIFTQHDGLMRRLAQIPEKGEGE
jgi:hypothetical protein